MNIQILKDKSADLFQILEVSFSELSNLDQKRKEIEEYDHEVRENEKKILLKEDSLNIREKNLENDVHALQLKREELARLEQKINHSREQIIKAKEQLSILDEKLKEMQIYEVKINEKKKELENLKPKEDELAHRETMLQKEKEIDRKRKEHLDNRVKKIRQVEQRLQIEADDNLE